jgi:hypothetical protein
MTNRYVGKSGYKLNSINLFNLYRTHSGAGLSLGRLTAICFSSLISLALLSGCTGNSGKNSSTVKLQFPDWNQLHRASLAKQNKVSSLAIIGDAQISLVAINITGPGIDRPIFFSWQNKDGRMTAPQDIALVVPRGAGRLVQALAIYEGGATQFYYADKSVDTNSDNVNVGLTLTNVVANAIDGNIIGRFISADGEGYTGPFQYRFGPSGKPKMIVHTGEMFAGWTDGLKAYDSDFMSYTKLDGSPLFGELSNGLSTRSAGLFNNPAAAALIHVPAGFVNKSNGGGYSMEASGEQRVVAGFFGPGATTKRLCYESPTAIAGASDVYGYFKDLNADGLPSSAPRNPIKWLGGLDPVEASLPLAQSAYVMIAGDAAIKGGNSSSSLTSCATGDGTNNVPYVDYLPIDGTALVKKEKFAGFRGPFLLTAGSGNGLDLSFVPEATDVSTGITTAAHLKASWSLLPGMSSALSGVSIFYRTVDSPSDESELKLPGSDGLRCNEFRDHSKFSISFTEIELSGAAAGIDIEAAVSKDFSDITTAAVAAKIQVIVCPRGRDGTLFGTALKNVYNAGFGGGAGGGGSATKLVLQDTVWSSSLSNVLSDAKSVNNHVCYPLRIKAFDSADHQVSLPGFRSVTLTSVPTSADGGFYNDNSCVNPISGGNIPDFNGYRIVYFRANNLSTATVTEIKIADSTFGDSPLAATSFFIKNPGTTATRLKVLNLDSIYRNECHQFAFQLRDGFGGVAEAKDASNVPVSVYFSLPTTIADVAFFPDSDWDCIGTTHPPTTQFLTAGMQTLFMRMKYTGAGNTFSFTPPVATSASTATFETLAAVPVTLGATLSASQVDFVGVPNKFGKNTCVPVIIGYFDSNHHPAVNSSGAQIPLTFNSVGAGGGGAFYTSSGCDSATLLADFGMPAGQYQTTAGSLYYKAPSTAGTVTLTVTSPVIPGEAEKTFSRTIEIY